MTSINLILPGYDSLRPGHVYARPSPRARGPPQHELLCLWRATYHTPSQVTDSLAALAQLTLDGESPLSKHPPLARELALMSRRELKAFAAPSTNLIYYLNKTLPVLCPEQRTLPICGLRLLVADVPATRYEGLVGSQSSANSGNTERELLALVKAYEPNMSAWSVNAGWPSPSDSLRVLCASQVLPNGITTATDDDREYLNDILTSLERTIADPDAYSMLPDSTGSHEADALTGVLMATREYRSSGKISKRDWQTCLGLRSGCWPPRNQPPPES